MSSSGYSGHDPCPPYSLVGPSISGIRFYQPSESAPLLPGKPGRTTSRARRVGYWSLAFIILSCFSFATYHTFIHYIHCAPDPTTRDAVRRDWDNEVTQHAIIEREWQRKTQEHAGMEQSWKRKAEQHQTEVARRIHEERVRQAKVREEWAREKERHAHEFEELKQRERMERELERRRWQREVERREQHEEEERLRLNMYWGHIEAHTCTTYATREYTAQLMNLPISWKHRLEACRATPLKIHGTSYLPKSCQDKGYGVVIGRFEINQQEPACTTYWEQYDDKGCTAPGSGKRHFTHHLMNVPEGNDWREFCATTPIRFNHMQFLGAEECFTSVFGVYGRWELDDANC